VRLDATGAPEFDHWKWIGYWRPAKEVIYFKREVYRRALKELAPLHCGVAPERTARSD
jgi:putative (di)nucleoside polyphosphate hydrolase